MWRFFSLFLVFLKFFDLSDSLIFPFSPVSRFLSSVLSLFSFFFRLLYSGFGSLASLDFHFTVFCRGLFYYFCFSFFFSSLFWLVILTISYYVVGLFPRFFSFICSGLYDVCVVFNPTFFLHFFCVTSVGFCWFFSD